MLAAETAMAQRSSKRTGLRRQTAPAATGEPVLPRAKTVAGVPVAEFTLLLLLAAVAFLAYAPSLASGFVYDMPSEINEGFFTSPANLPDILTLKVLHMDLTLADRPGQILYFMLIAAVCGLDPVWYHIGSNLLHAANVALLFVVLLRLAAAEKPGLFEGARDRVLLALAAVCLLFALHPLAVETVAAVNFSSDLLVTFFTLLALLAAIAFRAENARAAWLMGIAGTLCAFAAVACKESGTAACAVLVVYWLLFRRHEALRPWLLFLAAAVLVTGAFMVARFLAAPAPVPADGAPAVYPGGSFFQALLIQPRLRVFMLGKILCPVSLSADYTIENLDGLSLALALPILAAVFAFQAWLAMKSRIGAMGVALYWLGLATVSDLVPLYHFLADRFYYLPLAGVAMQLFALLLMVLPARTGFGVALAPCFVAVVPMLWLGVLRQEVFASNLSLWGDTAQVSPTSMRARYNFGNELFADGRSAEAIPQYQAALKLRPDFAPAYCNLGNALMQVGRTDEAIAEYQQALKLDPGMVEAHSSLGAAYLVNGQTGEAIAQFREALRLHPGFIVAQHNLDRALTMEQQARATPVSSAK